MKALKKIEFPVMKPNPTEADTNKNKKNEDFTNQNFRVIEDAIYELEKKLEELSNGGQ